MDKGTSAPHPEFLFSNLFWSQRWTLHLSVTLTIKRCILGSLLKLAYQAFFIRLTRVVY